MLKRLILAGIASTLVCGAAIAQDIAPEQKQCLDNAFELAKSASEKKLPDDQLVALENMLSGMEDACDAKKYTDADAAAAKIKAEISKN